MPRRDIRIQGTQGEYVLNGSLWGAHVGPNTYKAHEQTPGGSMYRIEYWQRDVTALYGMRLMGDVATDRTAGEVEQFLKAQAGVGE